MEWYSTSHRRGVHPRHRTGSVHPINEKSDVVLGCLVVTPSSTFFGVAPRSHLLSVDVVLRPPAQSPTKGVIHCTYIHATARARTPTETADLVLVTVPSTTTAAPPSVSIRPARSEKTGYAPQSSRTADKGIPLLDWQRKHTHTHTHPYATVAVAVAH